MRIRIRGPQDFWAGVVFISVGVGFLVAAQAFRMGSAADIGPGYFPAVVSSLLVFVGGCLAVSGLTVHGPAVEAVRPGPAILITAGLVAFGLLIDRFGLALAIVALVLVSTAAAGRFRPLRSLALAAVLLIIVAAVFIGGLGMSIRLWPIP